MADVYGTLFDDGGAVFNVLHTDFGADSTGATDSTLALQAAIDAASAVTATNPRGGGTVLVPAGTYLVGNPSGDGVTYESIRIRSRVRFHLASGATLLAAPIPFAPTDRDRAVIETRQGDDDVVIDGGGTVDGQRVLNPDGRFIGIRIWSSRRARVAGLHVRNMAANPGTPSNPAGNGGDGVQIGLEGRLSGQYEAEDVMIEGVTVDGVDRSAFAVIYGKNVSFIGCVARNTGNGTHNNPGSGLDVEPDAGPWVARDIRVIGCHFENNNLGVTLSAKAQHVTVQGCTFRGHRWAAVATNGRGVLVQGNTIFLERNQGIHVHGGLSGGALVQASARVIGNSVIGSLNENERNGILIDNSTDVEVIGNEFRTIHGAAVNLQQTPAGGAVGNLERVVILANSMVDCVDPSRTTGVIRLQSDPANGHLLRDVTIALNTIYDSRTAPANADLAISVTTATTDAERATIRVFENIVRGVAALGAPRTQFVVPATIPAQTIPANGVQDVVVTVPDLGLTDQVSLNPVGGSGFGNRIVATVFPLAADQLRLRLLNTDPINAVSVPARDVRVLVTKS
ncbi:glycosyl hydrolase family 28-related protein [Longimicrobium terrae]|uniref:Pectate lyase superfamily protein domain-containing protein n=1 Tax=Longimicrobium terrae TaxID=1639882 RepID=A0A841GYI7_9BACT|nr:glycosyl hydrolase family 28-related protein [Longimicrobium terrae]MBB4636669.1 hypothetical protein [Longimicrobium terrae]MBB6070807.1 hypothetical protein [Longimicrobium terrae]NNC28833.1 hypothetical protein [Longimicrobium terrae]